MLTAIAGRSRQRTNLAELRSREFARLDAANIAYLDYAGAALYPESLVRLSLQRLTSDVFGNPHSESAPSLASTDALDMARGFTLRLFDADPAIYDVVFTANASGAIRILAEAFPFTSSSRLVMTADNHNSVNGLRMAADEAGSAVDYVPLTTGLRSRDPDCWLVPATAPSLFAYPAQSNFSGVRHPLAWVSLAQNRGYRVLLDAAAYATTSPLSLTEVPADFVSISYYKLFGYPTGVGALICRRDALAGLRRRYFAGGTVQFVSTLNRLHRAKDDGGAFEDGTPNFLAMPSVCDGLRWLEDVGMETIQRHVACLTDVLLDRLASLGDQIEIYGPRDGVDRGGTVAFNVRRDGRVLPYEDLEGLAREAGLAIRGGCFCNPGAAEGAFGHRAEETGACLQGAFSVAGFRQCLSGAPVGALRVSVGAATTAGDLDRLFRWLVGVLG